jgi:tetratricopeptide (TPR) repeat protein
MQHLAKSNESFAAATRILGKPEINTPHEIKQAVDHLNKALEHEKLGPDKSVIQTVLAQVYLSAIRDCREAKRYSSGAIALDPDNTHALEMDVLADFCFAETTRDYDRVIERMERLAEQGRDFRSLYSQIGIAYLIKSERTNARTDILKAKNAFLKAKERGEPEASPNALDLSIEELDRRLEVIR